jgi:hypothetical protein
VKVGAARPCSRIATIAREKVHTLSAPVARNARLGRRSVEIVASSPGATTVRSVFHFTVIRR